MTRLTPFVLALTALRLLVLAVTPHDLHYDEAQYWAWAQAPDWGYSSKPPLIAWLIALSTGLLGDSAWAVRLPAVLLHGVTALALVPVVRRATGGDGASALTAGALYALLPGVNYGALFMTTDAPLLLCWTLALWAWLRLTQGAGGLRTGLGLGVALGLGILSKYAMLYFLPAAALAALVAGRGGRAALPRRALVVAGLAAALIVAPNLIWNAATGWATVAHTAENAQWRGNLLNPDEVLEFWIGHLGLAGAAALPFLLALGSRRRREEAAAWRALGPFLLPLAVITVQALLSRANANWAAPAWVAGAALAGIWLAGRSATWRRAVMGVNGVAAALLLVTFATGFPEWAPPKDPWRRMRGWDETLALLRPVLAADPTRELLIDDRKLSAALTWRLRAMPGIPPTKLAAWQSGPVPRDHFEATQPWDGEPAWFLAVDERPVPPGLVSGPRLAPLQADRWRTLWLTPVRRE